MIYTQVVPASHLTPAYHPPCPPRSWPFPRTTQWPWGLRLAATWENGGAHSASPPFADTEEVTGSNPVAPTTVLAGHSVVDPEPVSLTSWLGRAGAAPHPHRRARSPFQARPLGHQARQ